MLGILGVIGVVGVIGACGDLLSGAPGLAKRSSTPPPGPPQIHTFQELLPLLPFPIVSPRLHTIQDSPNEESKV